LKAGRQPGDLAREALKHEKLMRAYDIRKKLEIIGAIPFSSPATQQGTVYFAVCSKMAITYSCSASSEAYSKLNFHS
jgi:hypothetical protein